MIAQTHPSCWSHLAYEIGIIALLQSSRDTKKLCLQRFVRLYAYGASFLILVDFLSSLGFSNSRIGLFMTLTLLGDVLISFVLTALTDRLGRRQVLTAGAAAMTISGVVFSFAGSYWALLVASMVGVISPSGNEVGPFRAVEESILAHLTESEKRSDIFAWYTLCGTAGAAVGTLTCGWMVQGMQSVWSRRTAYKAVFVLYAVLGVVKLILAASLSSAVELEPQEAQYEGLVLELEQGLMGSDSDDQDEQTQHSVQPESESRPSPKVNILRRLRDIVPPLSPTSRSVLYRLLFLFTIDSFASGMASPAWLTHFFTTVHSIQPSTLGTLFLITNLLSTFANLVALPIARRLGPLKTMVFTHLPSTVFLAMISFPPATHSGTWAAMAFLALRACTQSMDQAPRQAFIAAAVLPAERTAVLGIVNITKTLAQAGGIGSSGILTGNNLWTVVLGGAGVMKASYDLLLLWMFLRLPQCG